MNIDRWWLSALISNFPIFQFSNFALGVRRYALSLNLYFCTQLNLFFVALIKSISGIRGTIGGKPNENLTPLDIVRFSAAFGTWIKESVSHSKKIIIGRDGRISGEMVRNLVVSK